MPLHVHELGAPDGRPDPSRGTVLALHGVTGHGLRFRPLADALPDVRWLCPDLRGHGRSPWEPSWGLEQQVEDALEVLDGAGLGEAVVVGHSFGGAVATHLARRAPERVSSLILLDPAIGLDPRDMLEAAEGTRPDEVFTDAAAARAAKAEGWENVSGELVDAEVADHLVHRDGQWAWRYSRAAVVAAWSEMARPAVVPPAGLRTLLLPAAKVDYVSPAWVEACRAELGEALTVIEVDAGHMLYLERTAEVARLMAAFLDG
ncbi:MAG: alpha/beta hydrolase [Pseudonocardia sp.]|nr:alpha/beta hydrolase [Pseudonocardia sp.]